MTFYYTFSIWKPLEHFSGFSLENGDTTNRWFVVAQTGWIYAVKISLSSLILGCGADITGSTDNNAIVADYIPFGEMRNIPQIAKNEMLSKHILLSSAFAPFIIVLRSDDFWDWCIVLTLLVLNLLWKTLRCIIVFLLFLITWDDVDRNSPPCTDYKHLFLLFMS